MSELILLCCIFLKKIILIDCAPKIGHVLFDPLANEMNRFGVERDSPESSDSYLSDDTVLNLRTKDDFETEPKKPCNGYEFDENKCVQVNGRLLCGYNKNVGEVKNEDKVVDLGNGCHQRGDRIECGYVKGPFDISPRRPPVQWKDKDSDSIHKIQLRHVTTNSSVQNVKNPQDKMKAVMPEHEQINIKATKDLQTTLNEPKAVPSENTTTKLENIDTTKASTINITSTTNAETTTKANTDSTSAKISPSKTDSVTNKNISTGLSTIHSSLTNNIKSIATSNTTISSLRYEKTEITDVSPTSTSNETLSTMASEKAVITDVPINVYNLPKVETLREILKLKDKHTRKTEVNSTNGPDTLVSALSNSSKEIHKTVCVEKGDRIICYDFNV